MARKKLNVFSLSFLDIITCGLGAIILLFVLVNAKSAARRSTVTSDLRADTDRIAVQVLEGKKNLIQIRNVLEETRAELVKTQGLSRRLIETIREKESELADSDKDTLAAKVHVNQLKSDLKSLEEDVIRLRAGAKAQDELGTKLRPFPGQGDRQYLTDLKMGGRRIMILVDSSASVKGYVQSASFAMGKFGLRGLAQDETPVGDPPSDVAALAIGLGALGHHHIAAGQGVCICVAV